MSKRNRERREANEYHPPPALPPSSELRNVLGLDPRRFHPLADQVLLDVEVEAQSTGGIIIPQSAQQGALLIGLVREAGPKVTSVKAGDRVLVNPRDPAVSKIDVLFWIVAEAKLLSKVDAKTALVA